MPTVIYLLEEAPRGYKKSIFLLGPTTTDANIPSWRHEALRLLAEAAYDGVVFVPEARPGTVFNEVDYLRIVEWEERHLHLADSILTWMPRDRDTLPGITSSVVWGVWCNSGKIVFGAPEDAWKTRYLRYHARKLEVPEATTLEDTVANALELMGEGAWRQDGEREVPLFIWRTPHFQQWYSALLEAGNVLEHARVVWTHRIGPQRRFTFFWGLHAEVYITVEGRSKINEVVLARPDIATIVLFQRAEQLGDSLIVLISEFRTPVSNPSGYVWEVPGGSSFKPVTDPYSLAAEECLQETGLELDPQCFVLHSERQLLATMSAHRAHVFAAELTDEQVEFLRTQQEQGIVHGVATDTERTYVSLTTLDEIRQEELVDSSILGMLLDVLLPYRPHDPFS